jgi:hypothetical protein
MLASHEKVRLKSYVCVAASARNGHRQRNILENAGDVVSSHVFSRPRESPDAILEQGSLALGERPRECPAALRILSLRHNPRPKNTHAIRSFQKSCCFAGFCVGGEFGAIRRIAPKTCWRTEFSPDPLYLPGWYRSGLSYLANGFEPSNFECLSLNREDQSSAENAASASMLTYG